MFLNSQKRRLKVFENLKLKFKDNLIENDLYTNNDHSQIKKVNEVHLY